MCTLLIKSGQRHNVTSPGPSARYIFRQCRVTVLHLGHRTENGARARAVRVRVVRGKEAIRVRVSVGFRVGVRVRGRMRVTGEGTVMASRVR